MKIIDNLLNTLDMDVPVRSVLVGVHWTVVCSRHCGMATSLMSSCPHGHAQVRDAGHLHEKSVRELAQLAYSEEMLEASVGFAAINSVLEVDESAAREMNASETLSSLGRGKNVALVGHFPFIPQLRESVGQLWVIEKNPAPIHGNWCKPTACIQGYMVRECACPRPAFGGKPCDDGNPAMIPCSN